MKTKVKVVSVLLALFLIAALCTGLAFALPNLNFNLKGSLSYTPQTKTYYPLVPLSDGPSELLLNSDEFKISFEEVGNGVLMTCDLYGQISDGKLDLEHMTADIQSQYSPSFSFTAGDYMLVNSFDYRNPDPFQFSLVVGDYLIMVPDFMGATDGTPIIYIREDAPEGQLLYFGNYFRADVGWDLRIAVQEQNLSGQALVGAFNSSSEGAMLVTVEKGGYAAIDLSSVTFSEFDQTTTGEKQVQVTFTNPFTNLQTTRTITVSVYDPNLEETSFEISVQMVFIEKDNITASNIAQKLTASLESGDSMIIIHHNGTYEYLVQITQDMISDIKINEDLNMISCILNYSGVEFHLQFSIIEGEGNNFFAPLMAEAFRSPVFAIEAGTTSYNRFAYFGALFDNGEFVGPLDQATFKFTCDGQEMTLDQIYQTPGLKEIKVEVTLSDGREFVMFENFPVFVYDDENKIPTGADITAECWGDKNPSDMELLPDGSLDLSGCYLNVYYNCSRPSDQSLVLGQDYEQIPLSSDSVEVLSFKLFDPGSSEPRTVITSIIYRVEVNGQEVAFVTGP